MDLRKILDLSDEEVKDIYYLWENCPGVSCSEIAKKHKLSVRQMGILLWENKDMFKHIKQPYFNEERKIYNKFKRKLKAFKDSDKYDDDKEINLVRKIFK